MAAEKGALRQAEKVGRKSIAYSRLDYACTYIVAIWDFEWENAA